VLLRIYPELKYRELRDISFLLFSLPLLPSIKECREFMQKAYYWHLTEEDRERLKKSLSTDGFAKANGYLDQVCWSKPEEEVRQTLAKVGLESPKKEEFWQDYLEIRRKLSPEARSYRESRFLAQLEGNINPALLDNILMMERWLMRFQQVVDRSIVMYFREEFATLSAQEQEDVYKTLANTRPTSSDLSNLFTWVFHTCVFQSALRNLDSASWFGARPSETIITALSLKYPQNIPVKVQFHIARAIKEKMSLGWQRQQILTDIQSLI
jgi:hypothetical protein